MADPAKMMQDALRKNFPKFGGIRKLCTYYSLDNPDYDPDTGDVIPIIKESATLYVVFDTINNSPSLSLNDRMALDITPQDEAEVAIFPALDLPFEPKQDDMIVKETGMQYGVKYVIPDPAQAHYELVVVPVQAP